MVAEMGFQDYALILLRIAAVIFPPFAKILADAMATHTTTNPVEAGLADKIRAQLPDRSRSQQAVEALERDETIPIVEPDGSIADVEDEAEDAPPDTPPAPVSSPSILDAVAPTQPPEIKPNEKNTAPDVAETETPQREDGLPIITPENGHGAADGDGGEDIPSKDPS